MQQQTFRSPHWGNRPIKVTIDKEQGFIIFSFPEEWDREYYDIAIEVWKYDATHLDEGHPNTVAHMEDKVWFTSFIRKFINLSLGIQDSGRELEHDHWTERDEMLKQKAKQNGGFLSINDIVDNIKDKLDNHVN